VNGIDILRPRDGILVIAGRDVAFEAHANPPERDNDIRWSSKRAGAKRGPVVSLRWQQTGVDRVVASVGGHECGVTVYIVKTPTGGSTLSDVLQSEPPIGGSA